jgi:hypothetical protein
MEERYDRFRKIWEITEVSRGKKVQELRDIVAEIIGEGETCVWSEWGM